MIIENDTLRHRYQDYLEHARGHSPKTIDTHLRAIAKFDQFHAGRSFGVITTENIIGFRKDLLAKTSEVTGNPLSASTIVHTLAALRDFFDCLFKTAFPTFDRTSIDYFTAPLSAEHNARTRTRRSPPRSEEIARMIDAIRKDTLEGKRDAAVIALIFLSGIRDGALITLKIKHILLGERQINQDANEVQTKFRKNQVTTWFPVGEQYETILRDWVELRKSAGSADEDPLFPKALSAFGVRSGVASSSCLGLRPRQSAKTSRMHALRPICLISIRTPSEARSPIWGATCVGPTRRRRPGAESRPQHHAYDRRKLRPCRGLPSA